MYRFLTAASVLLAYILLFQVFSLGQQREPVTQESLVIEQICNGFPGTKQKEKTRQKVILKGDMMFMENLETPNLCIVRGDKKLIWAIDEKQKEYKEMLYSYFDKLKKDKAAQRTRAVKMLNALKDAKLRAEHSRKLGYPVDKNGYVPGKVVSKTEVNDEEKVINGFKCYNIKIYEDLRVVMDLWLTKQHKVSASLMEFYKNLGCFSDEVVAEMGKIKDFPIVLKADLDFGSVSIPIECEITKLEKIMDDTKSRYELPEKLTLIERFTDKGRIPLGKTVCPTCGKDADPNKKGTIRFVHKNVAYLFDSRDCQLKFVKLLKKHKDVKKVLEALAGEQAKKNK